MVRVVVVLAALAIAASSAAAQTAAVEHGKKVYAAEKCSICHAIGGVGNKKGPLDKVGAKLSTDEIRQWIVNAPEMTAKTKAARKPAMKSYTGLSKEDLDALVAYMASLK